MKIVIKEQCFHPFIHICITKANSALTCPINDKFETIYSHNRNNKDIGKIDSNMLPNKNVTLFKYQYVKGC